jgi:hypothetical protein
VIIQEVQESVRFLLLEADDASTEDGVDIKSLLACCGVDSDDGVLSLDGFSADGSIALSGALSLLDSTVDDLQSLQTLLELVREAVVSLNLRDEEGVTTDGGLQEAGKKR